MKKSLLVIILLIAVFVGTGSTTASAQCAMCTINAEQGVENGNTQAKGLNKGVLYLMAMPYLMVAGLGILWYKRYRNAKSPDVS